jgi:DNA-directed RNA polymerase specialized sigma24 family protein
VLVLRLFDDKSYAEIAAITGRKVGTVGWLISVGMKALAEELSPLAGGQHVREVRVTPAVPTVQSLQGGVS